MSEHGLDHVHLVGYQRLFVDDRLGGNQELRDVAPRAGLIQEDLVRASYRRVHMESVGVSHFHVFLVTQQTQSTTDVQDLLLTRALLHITIHQLTQTRYNGVVCNACVVTDELSGSVQVSIKLKPDHGLFELRKLLLDPLQLLIECELVLPLDAYPLNDLASQRVFVAEVRNERAVSVRDYDLCFISLGNLFLTHLPECETRQHLVLYLRHSFRTCSHFCLEKLEIKQVLERVHILKHHH